MVAIIVTVMTVLGMIREQQDEASDRVMCVPWKELKVVRLRCVML